MTTFLPLFSLFSKLLMPTHGIRTW